MPLDIQRVESQEDKEMVGAAQIATLLKDEKMPFHGQLCVEVEDSGYSKPAFLADNRNQPNLVTITRARNTRIFYRQPASADDPPDVGHPTWYGEPFNLSDERTWQPPDATATTTLTSLSGNVFVNRKTDHFLFEKPTTWAN